MPPAPEPIDVIIYHNPECGTSRNTLGLIRNAGIEPHVIEYLKSAPSRVLLKSLIERMGPSARDVVRIKGTPFHALELGDPRVTEDELLDAMIATSHSHQPGLVVAPLGVKLCRPSEAVLDLLPAPQLGEFRKEDAQLVVDGAGQRVL